MSAAITQTRRIVLHGHLREAFGKDFDFAITSVADAVRLFAANFPTFRAELRRGNYRIVVGDRDDGDTIGADRVNMGLGGGTLHFVPVVEGSKDGLFETILGILLIAISFIIPGGWAITPYLFEAGVAMTLMGVARMLTPMPNGETEAKTESYIFDGATQTYEQGWPVPLAFGELTIGSHIISAGFQNEDINGNRQGSGLSNSTKLESRQVAEFVELLCEGEVEGLVEGPKSILLDGTPLQAADGTWNFDGVEFEYRRGTANQSHLKGFPKVETPTFKGSIDLEVGSPIIDTITDVDVDAIRVQLKTLSLFGQTNKGEIVGKEVTVAVSARSSDPPGPWTTQTVTIKGKALSPYTRDVRIELPGDAPWELKVERTSAKADKSHIQDGMLYESYTEIVDHKMQYINLSVIGLRLDAQRFGTRLPARAYAGRWKKCRVPNNYNPKTRKYSGLWNGTFKNAWTNNPAWCTTELLTTRNGANLDIDQVGTAAMYSIGQYCDAVDGNGNFVGVDDGNGGKEARFTFNGIVRAQEEAFSVINAFVSTFRGLAFWSSGQVIPSQDAPADPVYPVSPANIEGEFIYQDAPASQQHSVALVMWNDPADEYKLTPEAYIDNQAVVDLGWNVLDVTAFACTSRGQARRLGKWAIETEKTGAETVTYTAGLDHAFAMPGEVIALADPGRHDGIRLGGRALGTSTSSRIYLDVDFVVDAGGDYSIRVAMPDGTIETKGLVSASGTVSFVDLVEPLRSAPADGAMYLIEDAAGIMATQWRVLNVVPSEQFPGKYEVTATAFDPTRFAKAEDEPDFDDAGDRIDPLPDRRWVPKPTAPDWRRDPAPHGGETQENVNVSWERPTDPEAVYVAAYELRYQSADGTWVETMTSAENVDIIGAALGPHEVEIRAVNVFGFKSDPLTTSFTVSDARFSNLPAISNVRLVNLVA